jgi:hypothetical protein
MDTSSFLTPAHWYYSFESVPGFWDALIREHKKGLVFTLDAVRKEISPQDNVNQWFERADFPNDFVLKADGKTMDMFKRIIVWTQQNKYFGDDHKRKFAAIPADGLLVAFAQTHLMTVVTEESLVTDVRTKKIKIPNVCKEFGVPYINVAEMLKRLNVHLILENPTIR